MKQRHLIMQNILTHGSCIHANRDEWELIHITEPRPSCLDSWRLRNELRSMFSGDTRYVNGIQVYKCAHNHAKTRYIVNGGKMIGFDEAVAILERPLDLEREAS